ncbi:hypothetical protein CRX57_10050 [Pseudomonas putida]|uniref:Uncharacterized protein n=1 Tax=Pseudomonas putida TaxID=303 RepID=A0A2C5W913_PSEPU|nr:hypothetical protein CRX57_10050 [Pseudomonas putida]
MSVFFDETDPVIRIDREVSFGNPNDLLIAALILMIVRAHIPLWRGDLSPIGREAAFFQRKGEDRFAVHRG